MRYIFLVLFTLFTVKVINAQSPQDITENCESPSIEQFQSATHNFIVPIYKAVSRISKANFVFSSHSIWLMLAAIAEGSNEETQGELFKLLNLPSDVCIRRQYYKMATNLTPGNVRIVNTRALILDEGVTINSTWVDFIINNNLLDVVTAPMKSDPNVTENEIKRVMGGNVSRLQLSGNSVLIDTIDYNELWAAAFADAVIKRAPFYSQEGDEIGSVDLMRVTRKAKMGYIRYLNAKVLELPVGSENKYRMLCFKVLDRRNLANIVAAIHDDVITEMFESLQESNVPIDIAIPRSEITGETDLRAVLEDLGVTTLWTDEEATKYISTPSALPSSYVQRATVTLHEKGVTSPPSEKSVPGASTGLESEVGTDFIANQPFLMWLFHAETLTPLIAVAFTQATYPNVENAE